jgi:hypothetical protein
MWRFPKIMASLKASIGFRNFENYRLRVRIACG